MRVLHLAPLWFEVSQDAPGGIETILMDLLTALEKRGCRNTLLASGDSRTPAELVPVIPQSLTKLAEAGQAWEAAYAPEQHQLRLALERMGDVDVIHSHVGWNAYILSALPEIKAKVLHTQHNPVYDDLEWFVRQHPDMWFSVVSEFQARKLRRQGLTHCRVIPNGLDVSAFTF